MALFSGNLSYTRHYIEGELPKDFQRHLVREVQKRALRPLAPDDEDLVRVGWCRAGEPFELEFADEDVFYNEYVNLGLRIDKWVVPGQLLRAKMREAEAAFLQKKGRERMTRIEKKELKELVAKKLRRQLTPSSRAVDISWSLGEGLVRLFSQSPAIGAHLADLFYKTFGVKLMPESPYALASRLGLGKAEEAAWEQAEPTAFLKEAQVATKRKLRS